MKLIIFDIDGTLVFSEGRDSRTFAETFHRHFGVPLPSLNWHDYPHMTDTTILQEAIRQQFQRDVQQDEFHAFQEAYTHGLAEKRAAQPHHYRLVPGAKAILAFLEEKPDVAIGIATGGWRAPQSLKLDHVALNHHHWFFHGADGHVQRESILQAAIDEALLHHAHFDHIVYIGDALWDVHTTRNMNLPFVGIRWRDDRHVLENVGAKRVLQDFRDQDAFWEAVLEAEAPE